MEEVLIFGHQNPDTDAICSSLVTEIFYKKQGKFSAKAVRLGMLNKETKYALKYIGVKEPELIEKVEDGQEVILVDHNEFQQSAPNIENAKIIGVYDHHRIGNIQTAEPLYYTARPYGCTATVLFREFKSYNIEIEKKEALLMLSAIISDTLLIKSPTCTKRDVEAFYELEKIAEIDAKEYGLAMLKAGTDLSSYTAEELINLDAKEINDKGKHFVLAQVNTVEIDDVFKNREEIKKAMEKEIEEKKLNLIAFVITDIINSNSKMIVLGKDKKLTEKAFGKSLDDEDAMMLEGVVSRKKQILPQILNVI